VKRFAEVLFLFAALILTGCAEQSALTAQQQQIEDENTRLYNERIAAMQQAEKSYEDNAKLLADMYAHADTPQKLHGPMSSTTPLSRREKS
jgi:hypothetical protein